MTRATLMTLARLHMPVVVLVSTALAVELLGGTRGGGPVALVALVAFAVAQAIACRERIHRHRRSHARPA